MNKNTIKGLLLFVLLVMPVIIFVFLKSFGENQYKVEKYHQHHLADSIKSRCGDVELPHRLDLTFKKQLLLIIPHSDSILSNRLKNTIKRIQSRYGGILAQRLYLPSSIEADEAYDQLVTTGKTEWENYLSCQLLTNKNNPEMVLIDSENIIRGYYGMNDPEETDRLLLEIEIIKRNGYE